MEPACSTLHIMTSSSKREARKPVGTEFPNLGRVLWLESRAPAQRCEEVIVQPPIPSTFLQSDKDRLIVLLVLPRIGAWHRHYTIRQLVEFLLGSETYNAPGVLDGTSARVRIIMLVAVS